jgi:hypothetical protein
VHERLVWAIHEENVCVCDFVSFHSVGCWIGWSSGPGQGCFWQFKFHSLDYVLQHVRRFLGWMALWVKLITVEWNLSSIQQGSDFHLFISSLVYGIPNSKEPFFPFWVQLY